MPVTSWQDDPWASKVGVRGTPGDELVSALHKYIRRSMLPEAALVAREMFDTSTEFTDHLWSRLCEIASSDLAPDQSSISATLDALRTQCLRRPWESGSGWVFIAQAVRVLCEAPKDRATDELSMWVYQTVFVDGVKTPIADYVIDNHTKRGQELGRGVEHFLQEGCANTIPVPAATYEFGKQVRDAVERGDWIE